MYSAYSVSIEALAERRRGAWEGEEVREGWQDVRGGGGLWGEGAEGEV